MNHFFQFSYRAFIKETIKKLFEPGSPLNKEILTQLADDLFQKGRSWDPFDKSWQSRDTEVRGLIEAMIELIRERLIVELLYKDHAPSEPKIIRDSVLVPVSTNPIMGSELPGFET